MLNEAAKSMANLKELAFQNKLNSLSKVQLKDVLIGCEKEHSRLCKKKHTSAPDKNELNKIDCEIDALALVLNRGVDIFCDKSTEQEAVELLSELDKIQDAA